MANIIDIFKAGGIKTSELVGETGFYSTEQEIYENSKAQQKFISNVDYSSPENFAKFGSAEEYYRQAIDYIANNYPQDGSAAKKTSWINSLNEFEYYLFKNEYPRSIGSVTISGSQNITCEPYSKDDTDDAKYVYLNQDLYKYNTQIQLETGITFESWIKLETESDTKIVSILSGSQNCLAISATGSNFKVSGSAELTLTGVIQAGWHHYAFRIDSGSVDLFVDGQKQNSYAVNIGNLKIPAAKIVLGGIGKLSLDETRLWSGKRSIEKIGRFWFTGIGGNEKLSAGDPRPLEPQLILYYKYNEGLDVPYSYIIKDSSGRQNHAIVTYPEIYTFRNIESAINACQFVDDVEQEDPIFGDKTECSALLDFYNNKISIGAEYDTTNLHSLYKKFPTWILESEESNETKHLKQLVQVISVYFDDLYNKISELSGYKHQKIVDSDDKIYPFYDKILTSTGFDVTELFSNLEGVEIISSRDDLNLYNQNIQKVKNYIYQNIYNNLAYILKSKGSEKSLKSLLHSYGVDENLVKINLYGDLGQHNAADKYKERYINKKTISLSGSQYISGSYAAIQSATVELQTYLPSSLEGKLSLLAAGPVHVLISGSGTDLKLELSSSSGSSLTEKFTSGDGQMPWNIAVRKDGSSLRLDAINYETSNKYTHVSASASNGDAFVDVWVGASSGYSTDAVATDVAVWNTVLPIDTLHVHAKDITNYGIPDPKTLDDSIVLYWDFEKIVAGQAVDLFGNVTGYTSGDLTANIEKRSIKTYKKVNFDTLDAEDTIQVFEDDDIADKSQLKKPESTSLLIENSMYQIISDEMINMFSSIGDYVFQFAEAGNLYADTYKNIDILRNSFFSRVLNTPDIEKYVEFYKWLDSSLGYMLDQLKPENSNSTSGLKNTIESHMLERNKFKHKLPLTIAPNNVFEVSASILRGSGSYAEINPILADHEGKKYRGMVSSSYREPVVTVKNTKNFNFENNYEVVQTSGKSINNRGIKENKTVFRTSFSSADGLSETYRDTAIGEEYSIYNSLLNKSNDARTNYNISQSHLTGTQGKNTVNNFADNQFVQRNIPYIEENYVYELSGKQDNSVATLFVHYSKSVDTNLLSGSGSAGADINWTWTAYPTFDYVLSSRLTCSLSTLDPYTASLNNNYNITGDGSLRTGSCSYMIIYTSASHIFVEPLLSVWKNYNTYELGVSSELTGACNKPSSGDPDKNCKYSSNFMIYTSSLVDASSSLYQIRTQPYQAIPDENVLALHRSNTISASNIGYREPPVEWDVPMRHNLKTVGAFENMDIVSPYSSKINHFANTALNTQLIGANSNNTSDTFYAKIDAVPSGAIEINRIEHLQNVFPPRTLMGLKEIRSKPGYDEVSGSYVSGTWSADSYNRNTALINSFWRTNEVDRRRTRGMDNPPTYSGSINCLGEYNKYDISSNILSDRTGSDIESQYFINRVDYFNFYIKLQVKCETNRYDSIYSMDSIGSKSKYT